MALFEDMFEGVGGTGLGIIGAVILAPILLPVIGGVVRPAAKAVLKTGIGLYREAATAANDVYQEAASELATQPGSAAAPATGSPKSRRESPA